MIFIWGMKCVRVRVIGRRWKKQSNPPHIRGKVSIILVCAVDIVSAKSTALDEKQKDTPEAGKMTAKNCHKYGFILRYPVDKTEVTGIIYEPWHYRYVGKEDAKKIMERGITLEEYLGE